MEKLISIIHQLTPLIISIHIVSLFFFGLSYVIYKMWYDKHFAIEKLFFGLALAVGGNALLVDIMLLIIWLTYLLNKIF